MGAIRLTQFGGIVPRTSPRLINENAAQVATNCVLTDGELEPLNSPSSVTVSSKSGPLLSIYRAYENGNYYWMTWPYDVDVVKATYYGTAKFCFTGDGEPRITNMSSIASGGTDYPHTYYTLGIPAPVTAPTVTPSGGTGSVVDRYYAYTFFASWDGVDFEGGSSPVSTITSGKVDATWAISGLDAAPPNSGTVTGSYGSGYTEFTDTVDHFLRVGEQVVISSTTLTVTAITSSKKFKVAGDYHAATSWARKAPFVGTITKQLYRSTGTTGQFQLVADNISGTTYNDTLTDAQIPGDELITADWEMPPVGLAGLIKLPSGAMAGFSGNKVYVSEVDQPHAWPSSYAVSTDFPVVAIACFGNGLVAATESTPYIINGVEPGQMSVAAWSEVLPCLNKRSMVSLGDSAVYASPIGLISVNASGCQNFSLSFFTDKEWGALSPETMVCEFAGRKLYVRYSADQIRTLVFNLQGDTNYLTEAHFDADELYTDSVTGLLYFTYSNIIYQFNPDDSYAMSQSWQSKEIILPRPQNLGAAKINFSTAIDPTQAAAIQAEIAAVEAANAPILATGKVKGGWAAYMFGSAQRVAGSLLEQAPAAPPENTVSFELYAGGKLRAAKTVTSALPFKLPSGYKVDTVSVKVSSQCHIKSIELGATQQELATV